MSPLSIVSLGLEQSTALPTTALRSAVNDSLSLSQRRRRRRKDREDDRVDDEDEEDDNGRASGGKRHARIGRNRPATEKGTQGGPPMHAELRPLPASLCTPLPSPFPPPPSRISSSRSRYRNANNARPCIALNTQSFILLSQITNLDYDFDPFRIKRKNKIKERSRVTRRKREREGG